MDRSLPAGNQGLSFELIGVLSSILGEKSIANPQNFISPI
jgi:hypothetical protein